MTDQCPQLSTDCQRDRQTKLVELEEPRCKKANKSAKWTATRKWGLLWDNFVGSCDLCTTSWPILHLSFLHCHHLFTLDPLGLTCLCRNHTWLNCRYQAPKLSSLWQLFSFLSGISFLEGFPDLCPISSSCLYPCCPQFWQFLIINYLMPQSSTWQPYFIKV